MNISLGFIDNYFTCSSLRNKMHNLSTKKKPYYLKIDVNDNYLQGKFIESTIYYITLAQHELQQENKHKQEYQTYT